MMTLEFDYFFSKLKAGLNIDETCFYFTDDPEEDEHYLGYNSQRTELYWAGNCDIKSGTEFKTAEELVNAPIFNGRSLKERWETVRICSIESFPLEDWMKINHETSNLKEKLEMFHNKPIDDIYITSSEEVDAGEPVGDEIW